MEEPYIFHGLTGDILVRDCDVLRNHGSGIMVEGARDVKVIGGLIEMPRDLVGSERGYWGCIYVSALEVEDQPAIPISGLEIDSVTFRPLAVSRREAIDAIIFRQALQHLEGEQVVDLEGEQVVQHGRYNISFSGIPNGHIPAPLGSWYYDEIGRISYYKLLGTDTSEGWVPMTLSYDHPRPIRQDDFQNLQATRAMPMSTSEYIEWKNR